MVRRSLKRVSFDYALRFGLAARYPAQVDHLVADSAVGILEQIPPLRKHASLARRQLAEATETLRALPKRTILNRKAAEACYRLASLDVVYRVGKTDQLYHLPSSEEIQELQELYRIIPWDEFRPQRRLVLNPTFSIGSHLVGGTDADIVLDDAVLEVKTVKDQALSVGLVRQIVGYALLANRYGMTGITDKPSVSRLGVYFSRAGVLHRFYLAGGSHPCESRTSSEFSDLAGCVMLMTMRQTPVPRTVRKFDRRKPPVITASCERPLAPREAPIRQTAGQ